MKLKIRFAEPDEFWRISEAVPLIKEETRYANRDLKIGKIEQLFNLQFQVDNMKVIYCCHTEKDLDLLVGFGAFIVSPQFFGDDLVGQDLMIWVHKLYRGSSAFYRIVKAYEQWAKSQNAVEICLSTSTGVDTQGTSRLYTKLGYPLTSVTHIKQCD